MKAAPKPEGGGSPETAGTGGSGGARRERERVKEKGQGTCALETRGPALETGKARHFQQLNAKKQRQLDRHRDCSRSDTAIGASSTATSLSIPPTLDLIIQDQIYTRIKIKDGIRRQ